MKYSVTVSTQPPKFATLRDFVWYLNYTGAKRDDASWHELLSRYTCDDKGVYVK